MHIEVNDVGVVTVVGSRRVAAHLHGVDLAQFVERTVDALVASRLVSETERDEHVRVARLVEPVDVAGWQLVLAAVRSPQHLSAAQRAYMAAKRLAKVEQRVKVTLAETQPAESHVYVWRRDV